MLHLECQPDFRRLFEEVGAYGGNRRKRRGSDEMPFDPDVNEIRISIHRRRHGRIIPLHRGKANCDERRAVPADLMAKSMANDAAANLIFKYQHGFFKCPRQREVKVVSF